MKIVARVACAAVISMVLVSCIGGDSPDAAAKAWFQAVASNDGNNIGALTCREQQGNTQLGLGALTIANLIGQGIIGQGAKFDVSDLHYTTTSQSGSTAIVHVAGDLRVAVLALFQSQPMNADMNMRLEDGRWKYCGGI